MDASLIARMIRTIELLEVDEFFEWDLHDMGSFLSAHTLFLGRDLSDIHPYCRCIPTAGVSLIMLTIRTIYSRSCFIRCDL